MLNPIEYIRQRNARRRYLLHAQPRGTGRIAKVSLAALAIILVASAVLELGGGGEARVLAAHLEEKGIPPLELIEAAARGRRLVFLADIAGASAPKRLAADAVEKLGLGIGLDAVGLEVPASEQPYIDLYLNTPEEDAGILLARPRAIRGEGSNNPYFELYRRVRRVNEQLSADRRIRIVALDSEAWPPERALAPNLLAQRFSERDAVMAERVQDVLQRSPRARMLLFVSGLQALESGGALVQTGGTRTVEAQWLAARLKQLYPQDVFTILLDAPGGGAARPLVAAYRGTAAGPLLEEQGAATAAVSTRRGFDFSRSPIRTVSTPGMRFELNPRNFALADVADAYIYLAR